MMMAALVTGAMIFGGCNGSKQMAHEDEAQCKMVKPGSVTTANKMCVVMFDDPVNPATEPVVYKGQKYGLCCEGCRERWEKMTDAQKEANIARAMAASK
jgi:hypothetical protein